MPRSPLARAGTQHATDRAWPASVRVFAVAATAMVAVAAVLYTTLRGETAALLGWVENLGWLAAPLFVLLYALEVVVLLPGIVFPLAAGFFFGWGEGAVLSVLGKLLGATAAFLLARRVLSGRVSDRALRRLAQSPRLSLLADALPRGGWRMVGLVRLVPIIPFKLSNYLFGWSEVRLRDFVIGTLLGVIPYSLSNAYLGSAAAGRGLSDFAGAIGPGSAGPARWWVSAAVALLATGAAMVAGRHALQVLHQAQSDEGPDDDNGAAESTSEATVAPERSR